MPNPNHPPKGSIIAVDPIRALKDIRAIKKLLSDKPRDLALFVIGINTNLRASDLTRITLGHVRSLKAGDSFTIREKKTGKVRGVVLNKDCLEALKGYLATRTDGADGAPLFRSQRGGKSLSPIAINRLVKSWCGAIKLESTDVV